MSRLTNFDRMTGLAAMAAGVSALGYSISVVIISRTNADLGEMLSGWFLVLGALLVLPVLVALYQRLRPADEGLALLALILSLVGTVGAMMHGGYVLANAFGAPGQVPTDLAALPSQVDPRGLFTFAITGLGWFIWAALLATHKKYPVELGQIGYFLGSLLTIIYLAHLFGFGGDNPVVLIPSIMVGFFVYPTWYIWLGSLFQGKSFTQP